MGEINVGLYDKIMTENWERRKYENKIFFYINIRLIDGLGT